MPTGTSYRRSAQAARSRLTKIRKPASVGIRPAEVWGCSSRPWSSRCFITARRVAEEGAVAGNVPANGN